MDQQSFLETAKKSTAIIFILILIANLILYPMGRVPAWLFWSIIALFAIYAYLILPRLNR